MKRVTSSEVRQTFLDFFEARGHAVVPSASLVPLDDPSLLFTNAGMNQFKDVFLGVGTRPYTRATNTQKCMRVSGKHNDLEEVGHDGTHHTFFEMLGNWSFGDYYKREAITWAWELLTDVWGLPGERLWATVFRDDVGELGTDEEAARYWASETAIPRSHILFFGRKDNFWEMADTGPCGPNSEIHYDRGPEACEMSGEPDHDCQVNGLCGRFVELWNLVFIQYNRDSSGALAILPACHIDTGAGFERIVAVLQGVESDYATDLFAPILDRVRELLGHSVQEMDDRIVPYRVIADHGRAITFLIGDGVLPGNEGRNYVLRMILRRAARYGRALGFSGPFLADIASVVIDTMGPYFPELASRRRFILTTVSHEEERFLRTLDVGLGRLEEALAELAQTGEKTIPGDAAFRLYDTFGLPLEITVDVAAERGFGVDEDGYRRALEDQRRRARMGGSFEAADEQGVATYSHLLQELKHQRTLSDAGVRYDPYSTTETRTSVAALLRDGGPVEYLECGERAEIVLSATGFYVASGGQVSDTGLILGHESDGQASTWEIAVHDVWEPVAGLIVHKGEVKRGRPRLGDEAVAVVDLERRLDVARNHTATHLLHNALRGILGEHVQQAGSLVAADRLRFDFTHSEALTPDQIAAVAQLVNNAILRNLPVAASESTYRQAVDDGVIALFGEKYGDTVRVMSVGPAGEELSRELCGGTHVHATGEIGLFYIVSDQGIGAGVRRIEAVTGRKSVDLVLRQLRVLERAGEYVGVSPEEVDGRVLGLVEELQSARKEIGRLEEVSARHEFEGLLAQAQSVGGVPLLSARVGASSVEMLRQMTDWARDRLGSGVVVLGAVLAGRPVLVAAVTPDLVQRGADAAKLVQGMAKIVKGGGGGKRTLAQAGGRDPGALDSALTQAAALVAQMMR